MNVTSTAVRSIEEKNPRNQEYPNGNIRAPSNHTDLSKSLLSVFIIKALTHNLSGANMARDTTGLPGNSMTTILPFPHLPQSSVVYPPREWMPHRKGTIRLKAFRGS